MPVPRLHTVRLAGLVALACSVATTVAGVAAATPAPSPAPLKAVTPPAQTTAQAFRSWVLTIDPSSATGQRLRSIGRTVDARSAFDRSLLDWLVQEADLLDAQVVHTQVHAGDRVSVQFSRPVSAAIATALTAAPEVTRAEPDVPVTTQTMTSTPNDTYFSLQWNLRGSYGIHADSVWPTDTGAGQTVAVIDTGITAHPDLQPNLLAGYDFISNAQEARDGNGRDANPADQGDWHAAGQCGTGTPAANSSWHGSHVAGIIAAVGNNGLGVSGAAPQAHLLPVRALGLCGGTSSDIADAITWASGGQVTGVPSNPTPARVINLSVGGKYPSCPSYYQTAIDGAIARGTTVVVAAGNSNADASGFAPANCRGVISVAATGPNGQRAYYSNYGHVTLAAPGGDDTQGGGRGMVASTVNTGTTTPVGPGYVYMEGTSQAAPAVAATAALVLAANPRLTPAQVTSILTSTAQRTGQTGVGAGIVNADSAVKAARALASSTSTRVSTYAASTHATVRLTATVRRGSPATGTATGYAAGERLTVLVDGHAVGSTTTNSTGTATLRLATTASTRTGRHTVTVVGTSSHRSAATTFTVV